MITSLEQLAMFLLTQPRMLLHSRAHFLKAMSGECLNFLCTSYPGWTYKHAGFFISIIWKHLCNPQLCSFFIRQHKRQNLRIVELNSNTSNCMKMLFSPKHSCFMIQPTSAAYVSMETLKMSFKDCLCEYIFTEKQVGILLWI